ncbi:MAG: RIP metalloprotease RseP [Parvibaculales bacterium]
MNITNFGIGYIVPFLFVLTVVVFFHELGHFMVARWCKVDVEVFSVGFGRALWKWRDKKNTIWQICWLPLGGYVKFAGDQSPASTPDRKENEKLSEEERAGNFHYKPLWQRSLVVAAGPFANFLLAIIVFAGLFMVSGQQVTLPVIDEVIAKSAAERAGLQKGDFIQQIDGRKIESFSDLRRIVSVSPNQSLNFRLLRDSQEIELMVTPDFIEERDRFGNVYSVGQLGIRRILNAENTRHIRYGPLNAITKGTEQTVFIITQTMKALGRIITGRDSMEQLGGPLRIAQISGQMASLGMAALMNIIAIISVSIGLINLFPIPLLDGGHLLYYGVEAVLRRPLSAKLQEIGFRIGLGFVAGLFLLVTWNDLAQLKVFDFLQKWFT